MAVSYTHLDVYKRQAGLFAKIAFAALTFRNLIVYFKFIAVGQYGSQAHSGAVFF